jgi:hypothetical protein
MGKFTIAGRVVDVDGKAVVDAEVMVGKTMVYTGANGEFELTVGKRKAYAVSVEGRRVVSGAEIVAGEAVTIVVESLKMCGVVARLRPYLDCRGGFDPHGKDLKKVPETCGSRTL